MKILKTLFAAAAAVMMTGGASATEWVMVDNVENGSPWSTITVSYTLGEINSGLNYKVAFDVTANGVTKGVTNAAAKLKSQSYTKTIDTKSLFGKERTDPNAKVRVSLVAVKTDEPVTGGVQLWEDGPYWAECNVGATKPEEYGYYFWWGDTVGYKRNADNTGWISVKDGSSHEFSGCPTYNKSDSDLQSLGYIDSTGNLVAAYDAATAHLGAPWRMPTDAEFQALVSNCDTEWTVRNGVNGRLVKGRGAYSTKSIFLPAAGSGNYSLFLGTGSFGGFLSSTPNLSYSTTVWILKSNSSEFNCYTGNNCQRDFGLSVRPVRGFAK